MSNIINLHWYDDFYDGLDAHFPDRTPVQIAVNQNYPANGGSPAIGTQRELRACLRAVRPFFENGWGLS